MSLWTPDGEVPVERRRTAPSTPVDPEVYEALGIPDLEALTPDERAQVDAMIAEMAEAQQQILAAPASVVVANHAMGLFQLAALHLKQVEPDFESASLAIDAMAALVEVTADRLGEDGDTLREGVLELQRVFVARRSQPPAADGA